MTSISDARIVIMSACGFEQDELLKTRDLLQAAGATVEVATPDGLDIRGWNHTDWGEIAHADLAIPEIDPKRYHALVIPGGQINPDLLRVNPDAMKVARAFLADGDKTVAAVCHAPWVLIEADAVKGREVTSYHSIKKDVINAGGRWVDKPCVVSDGIVTSRNPGDLEAFAHGIIQEIEKGGHKRRSKAA